jgi:hypothetical protein
MNQIRLIGSVSIGSVIGHDGHLIDVTDENQAICDQLLKVGSAKSWNPKSKAGPVKAEKPAEDDIESDDDSNKLVRASPVSALSKFGIHGRYIKALTDAGVTTIDQLDDKLSTIADIPGISENAAKQIREVVEKDLED